MPINVPDRFPLDRMEATPEQLRAEARLEHAGLKYVIAYGQASGLIGLFSPSKREALREAKLEYQQAQKQFSGSLKRKKYDQK